MAEYALAVIEKTWVCIKEIKDRIEKIKESHEAVKSILEQVDFIVSNLERIKQYVDDKEDASQIKQCYLHLQNCKEKCESISQKNELQKFIKGRGMITQLGKVEDDLKKAREQLTLFVATLNLATNHDNAAHMRKAMADIKILSENPDTGIYYTLDELKKPPITPVLSFEGATANCFKLSWGPKDETVTKYELCYDEDTDSSMLLVKDATDFTIGKPRVEPRPGKIYTMKIRGINSGGKGQWSNSIVAQFTKPVPRQPPAP